MKRAKKVNRSRAGSIFTALFLLLIGAFMVLPMIYAVSNALKPTDELFRFPPKLFPDNPTTQNFKDLFILMNNSWVPFTRYFFNTLFITVVGTVGQIVCCSLCSYALALFKFPGNRFITKLIELALMFNATVLTIPTYMVISNLGLIDTYWRLYCRCSVRRWACILCVRLCPRYLRPW